MADLPYSTARWQRLRTRQLAAFLSCEGREPALMAASHLDHRNAISDGGDPFPPVGTPG
jgi:hypothetical protein